MHQMKLWIKRNKKIVKDIIDRTPGLFIDDKLNANDQIFKNTTDNFFNLPSLVQRQLNDTVLKKDFIIDDDKFDEYKKPATICIKQPNNDDRNNFVINPENEKIEISKSLLKAHIQIKDKFKWKNQKNRKPYKKLIKNKVYKTLLM